MTEEDKIMKDMKVKGGVPFWEREYDPNERYYFVD